MLVRAVSLQGKNPSDPNLLARAQFALARALVGQKHKRAEAIELARQARGVYAKQSQGSEELAEVERWLRKETRRKR